VRDCTRLGVMVLFCGILLGQSSNAPQFEIADVHTSAKTNRDVMRVSPARNGRYEIHNATMLNLIGRAFGFEADKILGGPNWLELDRYDVIAKVPADSTPETQKLMLQALLKDRFKLVAHEDTKPVMAWVLTVGKKPQMKEADGTGETGCKIQGGSGASGGPGPKFFRSNADGTTTVIDIGPGMTMQYSCRNMTMAAFAAGLRTMEFVLLTGDVQDHTGLEGKWNFDVKWSAPLIGPMANSGERITVADALERQLGLKLEEVPVPTKVLVVDSVERKPTDNPPGVKEALPEIAPPTEFEVADVKLADPKPGPGMPPLFGFRMQPGGRFVAENIPLRFLLDRAFNVTSPDQLAGMPGWADSVQVSITAKVAGDYPAAGAAMDQEFLAPLIRSLLAERFGLVWHTEQRLSTAYSLVAAKPKMKKADPQSRIYCKTAFPGPNQAPNEQVLNCQNATMAMFAERLRNIPAISAPVDDATGLDGGWDFSFPFNPLPPLPLLGLPRGGDPAGGPGGPVASDPGGGYTVFQSIEKQLGLKLEKTKKMAPVTVIDKLNQKPTEN
jgi:uncharacterized protein (TIGR03435 family)